MAKNGQQKARGNAGRGRMALAALFNVVGMLFLVAVLALAAPLSLPRIFGYEVYNVVSGSMEPEIPLGSAVYVKADDPAAFQEGDIIAFYDINGGLITHRVVTNRTSLGEFVTKGDANNMEDIDPAPYEAVIGRVEHHVPQLGGFMAIYSTAAGKIYLLLAGACGVMLNMVASRMRRDVRRRRQAQMRMQLGDARVQATAAAHGAMGVQGARAAHGQAGTGDLAGTRGSADANGAAAHGAFARFSQENASREKSGFELHSFDADGAARSADAYGAASANGTFDSPYDEPRPKRGGPLRVLRNVAIAALVVVFLGSGGYIAYTNWQYGLSDALYADANDRYASAAANADSNKPPIDIDFDALLAANPDVVGWIYCEGTAINYPVVQGKTNDQYLHHDYTGNYNIDGSIFVDADNSAGFADSNTIVYGHHMNSGSMFAGLVNWADQAYYDEHPALWLLTPSKNYLLVPFSAHHSDAYSDIYDIINTPGEKLDKLLADAVAGSDFKIGDKAFDWLKASKFALDGSTPDELKMNPNGRYVMLSTCAYLFDNDRYVLNCALVPLAD